MAEDFNPDQTIQGAPDFATTSLFGYDAGVAAAPVRITRGTEIGLADAPAAGPDRGGAYDTTLGQTIQDFWHLEPGSDALKSYQQDLFDAGFYPDAYYRAKNPSKLNLGVADDVDAKAWKDVTTMAARTGRPVMDLIDERKALYGGEGGIAAAKAAASAGTRAPFSAQVTNPLTLTEVAQKAAEKTLGRGFSPTELDRFVKNYQAMEVHAQQGQYDTATAGGTTTAAPDPTAAATAVARQSAPTEAYANDLMNVYDQALATLTRKPGG